MLDGFLSGHRNELVDELLDFVRVPAIAIEGGPEIARMAALAAEKCVQAGLTTQIVPTGGHPVVYAHGGPTKPPCTLLCYGHYDVFPADQDGWHSDPFEPVVKGDRIYGRGTGDNKGQFLAHLNAFQWWHQEAGGLPIGVKMILEGEEENGSRHLPEFVAAHHDELIADLCIYSDGPMLPGDRPAILFGARGAVALEFHSTGPPRPLHSGVFGAVVPNPIHELARYFAELIAPDGDLRLPEVAGELPPAELAALAGLEFDAAAFREMTGTEPLSSRSGEPFFVRQLGKASLTVSGISGGHTGRGVRGLVPSTAMAKADLRLVQGQEPDAIVAALRRFALEHGFPHIEVRKLFAQPPSRTPLDHPYADVVADAVEGVFGRPPVRVPTLAGTTPDHVFTRQLGIPAFMLPLAPADENHHGPNESMRISLFLKGIETSARLLGLLAGSRRPVEEAEPA